MRREICALRNTPRYNAREHFWLWRARSFFAQIGGFRRLFKRERAAFFFFAVALAAAL